MFQEKIQISAHQALMIVLAGAVGNVFVLNATPAVVTGGRDGWMAVLAAFLLSTLVGLSAVQLGLHFPEETIIQYLPRLIGWLPGKIVGLFYILTLYFLSALVQRDHAQLLRPIFEETPLVVLTLPLAVLLAYALIAGFEVFARTAELFVPISIAIILLGFVMFVPNVQIKHIFPILENGITPVLQAIPRQMSFGVETLLFLVFWLPCLRRGQKRIAFRSVLVGIPLAAFLLTVIVIYVIAFGGPHLAEVLTFPILIMSRYIQVGEFLTGFEVLLLLNWLAANYLQALVFLFPAVVGLAQWLNLQRYKPLVIPLLAGTVALAMVPGTVEQLRSFDRIVAMYGALPLGLSLTVLWLIARLRGFEAKERQMTPADEMQQQEEQLK